MDKRVIFAVAGSGKTTHIVDKLNHQERALVITYTRSNEANLKEKILNKFTYHPENIHVIRFFPFLYAFGFRAYLSYSIRAKGLFWDHPPDSTRNLPVTNNGRFMTSNGRLYHNRLSRFLEVKDVYPAINSRLEKYFDCLYIDEVQDFGGHDFNLLMSMCTANLKILLVGDFFQHTFDTSRDANVRQNLHIDYGSYQDNFRKVGVTPDLTTLQKSYRCSPKTCSFIRENLDIDIYSRTKEETKISIVECQKEADRIYRDQSIVKLFYQSHYKYGCNSQNWGGCKGEDKYQDVCIVLSVGNMKKLKKRELTKLAPLTQNKLYVALSRAKGNIFIVPSKFYSQFKSE